VVKIEQIVTPARDYILYGVPPAPLTPALAGAPRVKSKLTPPSIHPGRGGVQSKAERPLRITQLMNDRERLSIGKQCAKLTKSGTCGNYSLFILILFY
jgi:hypothetical protein